MRITQQQRWEHDAAKHTEEVGERRTRARLRRYRGDEQLSRAAILAGIAFDAEQTRHRVVRAEAGR